MKRFRLRFRCGYFDDEVDACTLEPVAMAVASMFASDLEARPANSTAKAPCSDAMGEPWVDSVAIFSALASDVTCLDRLAPGRELRRKVEQKKSS